MRDSPTTAAIATPRATSAVRLAMPGAARATTTATAIHNVAYAACPLGNDDPSVSISESSGRGRSTPAFISWTPT